MSLVTHKYVTSDRHDSPNITTGGYWAELDAIETSVHPGGTLRTLTVICDDQVASGFSQGELFKRVTVEQGTEPDHWHD